MIKILIADDEQFEREMMAEIVDSRLAGEAQTASEPLHPGYAAENCDGYQPEGADSIWRNH